MSGLNFTTPSTPFNDINFGGGLNSTSGPFGLQNNESPDLQNVDFNKFGSVFTRNGYDYLNGTTVTGGPACSGLFWYEFLSSGAIVRKAVNVSGTYLLKMDDLDGTWDDITGSLTITVGNLCDSDNFLNEIYITNGVDVPFKWTGSGNGAAMTVPANLTTARFVKQFNNYLFLANVTVSSVVHQSRIYWSNLKDTGTWSALAFIDVAKNDGQEITGLKVLKDRLVVFKGRSIYNVFFTGDPDIPFILPGGGKSNSAVGCIAPFSIQEVDNGLVFLSYDGFYFYDGNNSYKISDKITTTLDGYSSTRFINAVSLVQKDKNRYMCALSTSGQTEHDRVVVWDYFNNAWSLYVGLSPSYMATFYVDGVDERPYFGDYDGYTYRMDYGTDDNPLKVATKITSYYYTNWRAYSDLVDQKGISNVYIYYTQSNSVLTFSYTYDFELGDQYSQTLYLGSSGDVYGSAIWDVATYASEGGAVKRVDLTGRGRVVRFKFSNSIIDESFRIDGFGQLAHLETNA